MSIQGILFFSIENYLDRRRLICNIWHWKSSSQTRATIYLQHIPVSARQTEVLYGSFPNKSDSILSCNHCIFLCCLLRLAKKKKKINYFLQRPCCVLIRKEMVEELRFWDNKIKILLVLYCTNQMLLFKT